MMGQQKMVNLIVRVITKSLPVIAGAVGAWVVANYTILHDAFCAANGTGL